MVLQSCEELIQEKWLKECIDLSKKWFWKIFFQINEYFCFWKDYGECERDIKLVTTEEKRNKLVSEPKYHTEKWTKIV